MELKIGDIIRWPGFNSTSYLIENKDDIAKAFLVSWNESGTQRSMWWPMYNFREVVVLKKAGIKRNLPDWF